MHNICVYAKENSINDLESLDFYTIATYDKNEYIGDYLDLKGIKNKKEKGRKAKDMVQKLILSNRLII